MTWDVCGTINPSECRTKLSGNHTNASGHQTKPSHNYTFPSDRHTSFLWFEGIE
jgi:hypothetical protein